MRPLFCRWLVLEDVFGINRYNLEILIQSGVMMGWKRLNLEAGQGKPGFIYALPLFFLVVLIAIVVALDSKNALQILGIIACAAATLWLTIMLGAAIADRFRGRRTSYISISLPLVLIWLGMGIIPVIFGAAWLTASALILGVLIVLVIRLRTRNT
jgi:hypothetical protein